MLSLCKPTPIYAPSAASALHQPLPSPMVKVILSSWDTYNFDSSSDALAGWLNARWKKSGYEVSKETVCFTLRTNGRMNAKMCITDPQGGAFF